MIPMITVSDGVMFDPFVSTCFVDVDPPEDVIREKMHVKLCEYYKKKQLELIETPHKTFKNIVLFPTDRCDGRCSYCYNEETNNTTKASLTLNDLKEMLVSVEQYGSLQQIDTVRCFGGEPFLNEELPDLFNELKKINPNITFIISSGLLFDDCVFNKVVYQVDKMVENNLHIRISSSIDFGLPSSKYTRCREGNSYCYDEIDLRLRELFKHGANVLYTTNISRDTDIVLLKKQMMSNWSNWDYNPKDAMNSRVKYRFSSVTHDTLSPNEKQMDDLLSMMSLYHKDLPLFTNLYGNQDVVDAATINKLGEGMYLFKYYPTYCGVYSNMLEFFPNKRFGVCHMLYEEDYQQMNKQHPDYNTYMEFDVCSKCDSYLVCRGGCFARKKTMTSEIFKRYCHWFDICYAYSWKNVFYHMFGSNKNRLVEYMDKNER